MKIVYEAATGNIHATFTDPEESIAFLNCIQPKDEESKAQIEGLIAQLEKNTTQQTTALQ